MCRDIYEIIRQELREKKEIEDAMIKAMEKVTYPAYQIIEMKICNCNEGIHLREEKLPFFLGADNREKQWGHILNRRRNIQYARSMN